MSPSRPSPSRTWGGGRTRVTTHALFHTVEECKGMRDAGMEEGMNQSYAALEQLLATLR